MCQGSKCLKLHMFTDIEEYKEEENKQLTFYSPNALTNRL